ncbi:50S ribosomal protein L30 [Geobacter argillaceus]|jgi:large subunit ribosomal protein L30|uniref:50S ribosomal protein L30 n=1 Tax=Geobacter argillaceus TaxID=345631 RepID=A0A562VK53_9BACT|nr:50S ribosomal protein L30 [Geobacter argillaceus]MBI5484665.1 50S ribosomal protein L30 [Deltaproteobacteria bacterium]TWJ18319.1 LSU ribosomal protein L30P [Geobacter argillaceus]
MSESVSVTLAKSHIGRPAKHKAILLGLGLNKLNKTVTLPNTPEVQGMINKVAHLVKVNK